MLTEQKLEELRKKLERGIGTKIKDKRIRAIKVNAGYHWQPPMYIEVGNYYRNLEKDSPYEQVTAIFESTLFLVCTPDRGIKNDMPYFFAREDVRQVIEWK
ncbi:MAG: hypothetical protein GF315_00325 [candidate division Zixibacteria bacterium]|nr:hypothetical protein [candidate division Zixibacteria bacterium]